MDKGKEKVTVEQLEGTNTFRFKRTKIEDDGQRKENAIERAIREENRLRKMEMDAAAAAAAGKEDTEEDSIDLFLNQELEGTTTEGSTEEESEQQAVVENMHLEEQILSPKGSSTNNPKGIKKTNNPKGIKKKRVREEEEEEEEEEEKSKGDSSYADTCTSKFPTSLDLDDKGESMRSPPGDQGSSHRKNL